MNNFTHNSVLLSQSIQALNIDPQGIYIDGTFGRGGHTSAIAKELTCGKIIAFDKDLEAIEYGKKHITNTYDTIELIHSDFSNMHHILQERQLLGKVNGILLDLGVSSPQLDDKSRGFSFHGEDPLDMRMDRTAGISAKDWLASATEEEIANVIYTYGEERRSRGIARKIKEFQQHNTIETTKQLADIISSVVPKTGKKHPATRSFQAIRIYINTELDSLQQFLSSSIDILKPSGRLAIITFHSLEDRIVKNFIKQYATPPQPIKGMPILQTEEQVMPLRQIKKQKPSKEEIASNVRARSSILRIAEKC